MPNTKTQSTMIFLTVLGVSISATQIAQACGSYGDFERFAQRRPIGAALVNHFLINRYGAPIYDFVIDRFSSDAATARVMLFDIDKGGFYETLEMELKKKEGRWAVLDRDRASLDPMMEAVLLHHQSALRGAPLMWAPMTVEKDKAHATVVIKTYDFKDPKIIRTHTLRLVRAAERWRVDSSALALR